MINTIMAGGHCVRGKNTEKKLKKKRMELSVLSSSSNYCVIIL